MSKEIWEEDPANLLKNLDTDASHWARAFMSRIEHGYFTKEGIDEDLMISWFANAIENAKDSERFVYAKPDEMDEILDTMMNECNDHNERSKSINVNTAKVVNNG